jgi:FkbM family methyltransferase
MGKFTHAAKQVSLATGLYRPMRWLSQRVRPGQLEAFNGEVEFYRSLLPRNAVCFDIGANLGDKSEALLAAGAQRVVAFEPNPLIIPELRARCGHDKRWTLVQSAVGRSPGSLVFYSRATHGSSGFLPDWGPEVVAEQTVPITTVDRAISEFGLPDYLKVDVEGWEPEVFAGLDQQIPLISFEFHLPGDGVTRARHCLTRLREFGRAGVNIAHAESSRFHFAKWWTLDDMIDWFPGDLAQTLPGDPYGDFFLRAERTH